MANVGSFSQGQVTVTTAAAQLATAQPNVVANVSLYAHSGNASTLYLGNGSGVTTTTGYALEAGKSLVLEVENLDELWVIASGDSPKVSWLSE